MAAVWTRFNSLMLVLVFLALLAVIAMLATTARGGPLDPPAAPASSGVPIDEAGSWSRTLSAAGGCDSERLKCVLGGAGVLDRETGLVWQAAPPVGAESWFAAVLDCQSLVLGERLGWRLPRIEEYQSLVDETGGLPAGVFTGVVNGYYWSSTTSVTDSSSALLKWFSVSIPSPAIDAKSQLGHVWCVRGGAGIDRM